MLTIATLKQSADSKLRKIARRAAIIFAANGWTWYGVKRVPDAVEIEKTVKGFLTDKRYSGDLPSGSGRLVVYDDELRGGGGVTVALELGGLSGTELEALCQKD